MKEFRSRELAARARRTRVADEPAPEPSRRPAPGKLSSAEIGGQPTSTWNHADPGTLTLAEVGRNVMSPADAIAYARTMIDRRAEPEGGELDEQGVLASAFSFIEQVTAGSDLPARLRARLEHELDIDLSHVRIHTDDRAAAAARQLRARAFTIGEDIYFAHGAFDPDSELGLELIAHEVAHVAQNLRGASKGAHRVSQPGDTHERQADDFARRFTSLPRAFVDQVAAEVPRTVHDAIAVTANVARDVVAGANRSRPTSPASRSTIDRQTVAKPAVADDPIKRVKKFIATSGAKDEIAVYSTKAKRPETKFGVNQNGRFAIRYLKSQKRTWTTGNYTSKNAKNKDADLAKVVSDGGDIDGLRLHKVTQRSWVFTESAGKNDQYRPQIDELDTPGKWTKAYYGDDKRGIASLPKVVDILKWGAEGHDAWDPAVTEDELSDYRRAIEDSICEAYVAKPGKWHDFYDEVVLANVFPHPYKRIVGNVFEKLVAASTTGEAEFKVDGKQVVVHKKGKKGKFGVVASIGDGKVGKDGAKKTILAECKAWTKPPGSTEEDQADRYLDIISRGVAYEVADEVDGTPTQVEFDHVVYYFGSPAVSDLWKKMLERVFGKAEGKKGYNDRAFSVIPGFTGTKKTDFKVRYNPEFSIPVAPDKTHVHVNKPPMTHAGLEVKELDVNLDAGGQVTSGWIVANVNLAQGALKSKPKRETLSKSEDGAGVAPNRFDALSGKLDKLIGERLRPNAELKDDGVAAWVTVTPGDSGIPGFDLTEGEIRIKYTTGGALAASGKFGIERKVGKGTIGGLVSVSYSGKDWAVSGEMTVSKDVVEGLKEFKAGFAYDHGEVTITCDKAEVEKQFKGVLITGSARDVSYNTSTKMFSGSATLAADLGSFGNATASATVKNNKLDNASFEYDSPELRLPKKDPVFTGTLGGKISYDDGKLSGNLRGTARLALPGLSAISETGAVGLDALVKIDDEGRFSGSIKSSEALQFGKHFKIPKLEAKLDEEGNASAHFAIELSGIKSVKTAKLEGKIDEKGFGLEGVEVELGFGDPKADRVWGDVKASYQAGEGLLVKGAAHAKITDDLTLDGTIEYSTKSQKANVEVWADKPIELLKKEGDHTIFEYEKNIPLFGLPPVISLDLATSFSLVFAYGLNLGLTPRAKVQGLDLKDLSFESITAEMGVDAKLFANLIGTPGLGIGFSVASSILLSGSAGIKVPVTAGAELNSSIKVPVTYKPDGGLSAGASVGMSLDFGIEGAITPYAKLDVLEGLYSPSWDGDPLAQFTIMPKRQLFSHTLDFGDLAKKDPAMPATPPPAADVPSTTPMPKSEPVGGTREKEGDTGAKSGAESGTGVDINQLLSKFESWGPYASLKDMITEAVRLWKKFKGVIKDIKNAAAYVGGKIVEGAEFVGGAIADGADAIYDNSIGAVVALL